MLSWVHVQRVETRPTETEGVQMNVEWTRAYVLRYPKICGIPFGDETGPLGQSDVQSDWYSGRRFDPWSGHICYISFLDI